MPITINKREFQYVPDVGQERYAGDPYATGEKGTGNFTTQQQELLGRHKRDALLRYKDVDAFFCQACRCVVNVKCPRCRVESGKEHGSYQVFVVEQEGRYTRFDSYTWARISCKKCDFEFRVIVR